MLGVLDDLTVGQDCHAGAAKVDTDVAGGRWQRRNGHLEHR